MRSCCTVVEELDEERRKLLDCGMDFLQVSVPPCGQHIPESPLTLFLIPIPKHQEVFPVNSLCDLGQGPYPP